MRLLVALLLAYPLQAGCPEVRPPAQSFSFGPGLTLNYEVRGSGPQTLIALHGLGESLDTWRDVAPGLELEGTVYLIDLIGYGQSTKPAAFDYTAEAQADILSAFLRLLRTQGRSHFVLIGHSLGGMVALFTALREPVDRLVLIDPLVSFDKVHLHLLVRTLSVVPLNRLVLEALPPRQRAYLALHRAFRNDRRITRERICRHAQFLDAPGASRAFVKTVQQLHASSPRDQLSDLHLPALVIWGAKDPFLHVREGEKLAATLHTSDLEIVPRCGHVPQEEFPEVVIQAIHRFLARP